MIHRRAILSGALAIVLAPAVAKAEKIWRIAFFSVAAGPNYLADAFRQGLRDLGYVEGRNLVIEYRWMAGREDHYSDVAHELSDGKIDLIITAGHPPALAAKAATSQIPIIALAVVDPVGSGLAASLSHPGGNLTGFSLEVTPETNAKMVQLLIEADPAVARVGVLWNSANPGSGIYLDAVRQVADSLKITVATYDVRSAGDVDAAFRSLNGHVDGLVVFPEGLLWTHRRQIVDAARAARLPTIFGYRNAAEIGGLMSYGPDLVDLFRR
ncbi:MAG TPA: ABC transporter substrate-binding protein, partial [Stellaceae bacterium]|nr:ABC transporter substrate-binding protein [Stellaceae bacterium]